MLIKYLQVTSHTEGFPKSGYISSFNWPIRFSIWKAGQEFKVNKRFEPFQSAFKKKHFNQCYIFYLEVQNATESQINIKFLSPLVDLLEQTDKRSWLL